jgi:Fe-Mn family superoxide dismutase
MSRETLWFHFSRHQRSCFEPAAALIRDTEFAQLELEELVVLTSRIPSKRELFHDLAGLWNHQMFWLSMCPGGGGRPHGPIGELIERSFGTYDKFVHDFKLAAADRYGSGWLWLTWIENRVRIVSTANSDSPLLDGEYVLLALDLWEHAFYLDHQNRRHDYVETFLEELVDWGFANSNLTMKAKERSPGFRISHA